MNDIAPTTGYLSRAEFYAAAAERHVTLKANTTGFPQPIRIGEELYYFKDAAAAYLGIILHYCRHANKAAKEKLLEFEPLSPEQRKDQQRPEMEHYKTVLALSAEATPAITAARRMLQNKKRELYGRVELTHNVWAEYQRERAKSGFMFLEDAPGKPKVKRPLFTFEAW